ncbi:MAG: D-alanyl-D-alanine carboxypeptidase/D-alanyl-D-alanine-endopeptidase [Actinobacteria bacterium]|nr:D-alanyl-D-alanine carboxypeptidase/D-alanyl-D-alanine-endopeptidase [Actinomycetota bacterium]
MTSRRRRLTVSLSTLVALVSAAAAAALAFWPTDTHEAPVQAPLAAVLSPRRAPAVLRSLVATTRLTGRIDRFTTSISPTSCVAVAAGAAEVYAHNPDQSLIPASSLKLATAAAFLAKVGGTGTFTTVVRGAKPDGSGTVTGDLALIGGGDPLLSTGGYVATRKHPPNPATDIAALAAKLVSTGVRRVTGRITISDDRFDNERRVPTWKAAYTTAGDVGPLGALAVDDGFMSYAPRLVAADDPGIAAGEALRRALNAKGVVVDGPTVRSASPSGAQLAAIASAPYAEVVGEMLRESDNNTAELLLKELAHASGSEPATRTDGTAARATALRSIGVEADAVKAIDGSGLDRSDRASCAALLTTLTTKPGGYDLEDMLATAGKTGTLLDRFTRSPLAGRMRAKTGSLEDVTALVGVTDPTSADPLRFAFISNGQFTDAGGQAIQDQLVSALATYPEAPDAATLAP